MKLIAIVTLKVKQGHLPDLINFTVKYDCTCNLIVLAKTEKKWESYTLELSYTNISKLNQFFEETIKKDDFFREIEITRTLEEDLKGGQLVISGKHTIDTINDLKSKIISGNKIIHEKIDNNEERTYSGIYNTTAIIGGINLNDNDYRKKIHHNYADSERDSIIVNRFSGLNSIPLTVQFNSTDDFGKSVKSIEQNFRCLRFHGINNDYSISNLYEIFDIPVIVKENDELPVFFLTIILKLTRTLKMKKDQTSIGIVGLNTCSFRLTRLLYKCGYMKILGTDDNDNSMMNFEKEKGLATTAENVLLNTDIVIIMRDYLNEENYKYFSTGQIVIQCNDISILSDEELRKRGVREIIKTDESDSTLFLPGLICGIIQSNFSHFDDTKLIKLSDALSKILTDSYEFPDFFSNIHDRISNFISKL